MKGIAVGETDFKLLIENDNYYVDKTKAIEDILSSGAKVCLFPRPRRFGKSIFMSMLSNFFDIEKKLENKDLFKDLYISKSEYIKEQNTYPVIYLNLKGMKAPNYEESYNSFKDIIFNLYVSKKYVLDVLEPSEKEIFNKIENKIADIVDYKNSVKNMTNWLERYYNKKVIVLIDEYDAPINEAFMNGYYDEVMNIIQPMFSSSMKDNTSLYKGILTGILRVSRESMFSDFNNPDIYDIMTKEYNDYFGFTESETKELLEYYELELTNEVKEMYNGYNIRGLHIYNPWSILKYAKSKELKPYWVNTSEDALIRKLLVNIDSESKVLIEKLTQGESIEFVYDERTTYKDFNNSSFNKILNLLLLSGYLTFDKEIEEYGIKRSYLRIPNQEVKDNFVNLINNITYDDKVTDTSKFVISLIEGNKNIIENNLNSLLLSLSYFDTKEMFYHGYILGLIGSFFNKNYIVKSNRETGNGRCDIMVESIDKKIGIIIEFKVSDTKDDMEKDASNALKQMKEKKYYKELVLDKVDNIKEYAIVFYEKSAIVR